MVVQIAADANKDNEARQPFFMPFPSRLNPAMAESQYRMEMWSDKFGLRPTPEARQQRAKSRPELYIARSFPDATVETLTLLTEWIEWAFVIDDELDDGPLGRSVQACEDAVSGLVAVFDNAEPPGNTLALAARDLWRRTSPQRGKPWRRRLIADLRAWLWTYYAETVQRSTHSIPSIEEYRIHSRNAAGMLWFMDLYEVAVDVELPDSVALLPSFISMRLAAVEHAAFLNDILSVPKEVRLGVFHNAVIIYQQRDGMSSDAAKAATNDLATECVKRFLASRDCFDNEVDQVNVALGIKEGAVRCADGFAALIRGIHDWHLEVDRYTAIVPIGQDPDYLTGTFDTSPSNLGTRSTL